MVSETVMVALAMAASVCAILAFLWKIAACVVDIKKDINTNTHILEARGKQFDTFESSLAATMSAQGEITSQLQELRDTTIKILYINSNSLIARTSCGTVIRMPMTRITEPTEGEGHAIPTLEKTG